MAQVHSYWGRVFLRAFRETLAKLFLQSSGAAVIAVLVATIYVLLVWHYAGKDEFRTFLTQEVIGWFSPFLLFPLVLVWRMIAVPAELDAEAQVGLAQLKPKLRLSFTKDQGTSPISSGVVHESVSGARQAVLTSEEVILRVMCTNDSAHRIDDCQAFLVGAMATKDDGTLEPIGFEEPVQLVWSRGIASGDFYASLQPKIPKPIYVLLRRQFPSLLIYRQTNDIRPEYGILFYDSKKYRIWIQVNGPNDAADRICLDVWPIDPPSVPNQLPCFQIGVEIVNTGFGPAPSGVMKVDTLSAHRG